MSLRMRLRRPVPPGFMLRGRVLSLLGSATWAMVAVAHYGPRAAIFWVAVVLGAFILGWVIATYSHKSGESASSENETVGTIVLHCCFILMFLTIAFLAIFLH